MSALVDQPERVATVCVGLRVIGVSIDDVRDLT